jgi:hypothetical protein
MIIANVEDYRKQCEARLPRFLYDYISGGSYQENTLRANIAELQTTLLRQRVLVDESHLKLSIDLWDQALALPVVLGPVGMAGMYSSRGEVKAANAAKAVGVPFTLSTMGVCDVHEVARKTGTPPWFQLYMLKDRGFIKSVIERSVSAGSKVLVFTVDLPTPGRRYSEVHDGMEKDPTLLGMLGFVAQGATHPRWALDIITKGWPLKFGTVAAAMPKGVPYGKFVHDNFDASTMERHRMGTVDIFWKNYFERHSRSRGCEARCTVRDRWDFGVKPRWQATRQRDIDHPCLAESCRCRSRQSSGVYGRWHSLGPGRAESAGAGCQDMLRRAGVGICIGSGRRIRRTRHVGHPQRGAQGRHDSDRMYRCQPSHSNLVARGLTQAAAGS